MWDQGIKAMATLGSALDPTIPRSHGPFPLHDWQFWVATGCFVAALAWLVKAFVPIPFLSKRARAKKMQRRVSLTIEGKAQEK